MACTSLHASLHKDSSSKHKSVACQAHDGSMCQVSPSHIISCCSVQEGHSLAAKNQRWHACMHHTTPDQQQQYSLVNVQQQLLLPEACKVDALCLQPLRLTRALWVQQVHLHRVCVGGGGGEFILI
jgi:hypothetical protein